MQRSLDMNAPGVRTTRDPPTHARDPGIWIAALFWLARHRPWALKLIRPLAVALTVACSPAVRRATRANATRIFARRLSRVAAWKFSASVVASFFDFITDLGLSQGRSSDELRGLIAHVQGREAYDACRAFKRGCVLVTAHMGSFEVGLASLAQTEQHINVVFKRDGSETFERLRSDLRATLGVREAPIDDGWQCWLGLRDALLRDEVVVMQGDRAMPGQKSQVLPFLGGHLRFPLGPVRLAQLTGSPIVPVTTVRCERGAPGPARFLLILGTPILLATDPDPASAIDHAMQELAKAIEAAVARYPEQWLVLAPAFEEDLADGA